MQRTWRRDAKRYFAHAKDMRWFDKFRHYEYPDGKHWAVPWPIATCESGDPSTGIPSGNYYASSAGAYGLTAGGGFPQNMPPKMQDEYAYRQFQESGEAAWAPFEGGCPLR